MFGGNLRYPHLDLMFVPTPEKFLNPEEFPIKFSGTLSQKFFDEKKRHIPFPHQYNLFAAINNLQRRRVPNESFR